MNTIVIALVVSRILLGATLLFVSLNHLVDQFFLETKYNDTARRFMNELAAISFLKEILFSLQLIIGVLLISGYFVPVAVWILLPISVSASLFHLFLAPPATLGLLALILNLFLLWGCSKGIAL